MDETGTRPQRFRKVLLDEVTEREKKKKAAHGLKHKLSQCYQNRVQKGPRKSERIEAARIKKRYETKFGKGRVLGEAEPIKEDKRVASNADGKA